MISKTMLHHAHEHGFDERDVYGAYKIFFGTLVSESRLRIINLLRTGRKNVGEITAALRLDQTVVSHDLARLKQCGFVHVEVEGKFRYYRLNEETIKPLMVLIDAHMARYCVHILYEQEEKE